jgi:curved DNA-binding protein
MAENFHFVDYYETLQLSANADFDTIERVYRLLAKKYHPDNQATGNVGKFKSLVEAYRVLSDPSKRAAYDATYEERRDERLQILYSPPEKDSPREDKWVQRGVLSLLYNARRRDARNPGVGVYELERFLSAPEKHLEFHLWYLREKGWIARTDNGQFAITAEGVDEAGRNGSPRAENHLLTEGGKDVSG